MTQDWLGEEQVESRWEAAPAAVLVIVLQVALGFVSRAQDWSIWDLPWWVWLLAVGPETLLVVLLAWSRPRRRLEQLGLRRTVSLALPAPWIRAPGAKIVKCGPYPFCVATSAASVDPTMIASATRCGE